MSVYKGTRKEGVETDAPGAVALEDPDLFQSYVVCSQYEQTGGHKFLWQMHHERLDFDGCSRLRPEIFK